MRQTFWLFYIVVIQRNEIVRLALRGVLEVWIMAFFFARHTRNTLKTRAITFCFQSVGGSPSATHWDWSRALPQNGSYSSLAKGQKTDYHFHVFGCFNVINLLYNMTHIIVNGTDLDVFVIIRYRMPVWKIILRRFCVFALLFCLGRELIQRITSVGRWQILIIHCYTQPKQT